MDIDGWQTIRTRLQRATAGIHQRLHDHPGFERLMAGTLTKSEYVALLGRLYGFHWPLEVRLRTVALALFGKSQCPTDPVVRETAHMLRTDLLDVGVSEIELHTIPLHEVSPDITTPEELVGCLYVIEGSRLGGKIMARKLDRLLGEREQAGRRFLTGQLQSDPMHWSKFCQWLEAWGEQRDVPLIVTSACRTFEAMELWLCQGWSHV